VQTAAPIQNAAPVQTPVQTQTQPGGNSAELSALEALAGFGGEVPATAAQQTAPASQPMPTTGEFVATVKEGATVRLSLNADGSFRWTATASGKTSNFEGTFVLQNGSLQLVRADNQKLEGSMTPIDGGFNLRLSGQTDSGLNFVRG
jgi:hypothetical protein